MANVILRALNKAVNVPLGQAGLRLARIDDHDWSDTANFIPFERTLAAARNAKISVGDYVDGVMNGIPGSSQATIQKMADAGVFAQPLSTIVEIGPGTGRYLEKTMTAARYHRYEVYETAKPWADYLSSTYGVVMQRTDGYSLSDTADGSANLVHAHKVFSTVPFMATCCYFHEMTRVTGPGGWVVFDAMTERCLDASALETWATSGVRNGSFPAVMARSLAIGHFEAAGFTLVASHVVPMPPCTTELLIFRR